MELTKGKQVIQKQVRWSRWYPKKLDDIIITRWAEACSDRHGNCCSCEFLEECEDLIDRLITCMGVGPTSHREV